MKSKQNGSGQRRPAAPTVSGRAPGRPLTQQDIVAIQDEYQLQGEPTEVPEMAVQAMS